MLDVVETFDSRKSRSLCCSGNCVVCVGRLGGIGGLRVSQAAGGRPAVVEISGGVCGWVPSTSPPVLRRGYVLSMVECNRVGGWWVAK